MSTRSLPARPHLGQLKMQARELRSGHHQGHLPAAARIAAHHPLMRARPLEAVVEERLALADMQLVIAREYGFESWAKLKHHVEIAERLNGLLPHPAFEDAVVAIDAGDLTRLRALLQANPGLLQARTNLEPPFHYFTAATLLHHIAGNPDRGPLPQNLVEIARLLVDSGSVIDARTLGPSGGTTIELVCSSKRASDQGLSGPLIELLVNGGAVLPLKTPGVLDLALANHAPGAAEKLIELGVRPDLLAAAALGRMDLLHKAFDANGHLRARLRRHGRAMSGRDAIGLAMLYAYVRGQFAAVDFLLEHQGNWSMIGVGNGTALHRAAWDGDLAMVRRLVASGADMCNRNNPFTATPFSWAAHNHQAGVCDWMKINCPIDLHDAVSFDLQAHVIARLAENHAAVDGRIDHWDLPQSTALHWAARLNRTHAATLLLAAGANPDFLAGNGSTALDLAIEAQATEVAELIELHGGKRAANL
jgi:ankyrin repeat protein